MKKILVLSLVLAAATAFAQEMPQTVVKTSEFPIQLGYTVELPRDYDSTKTYPLIVALHGFGDRMSAYVGTAQSFVPEGAIGLYPESPYPFPMGEEEPMGWTWWYWSDTTEPVFISDEVTLDQSVRWIVKAIEETKRDYRVDPSKVFLFGFSQGGFMTYAVGLEYPTLFRGLLPAGGWIDFDSLRPLVLSSAALKVPVRILHGVYDDVVEFQSAQAAFDTLKNRGLPVELMRYPAKHQLTSELYEDAKDFVWRELNRKDSKPLVDLLWPPEAMESSDHIKLLKYVLCAEEPVADIEAGLLKLYSEDTSETLRKEIIYLLGACRCTGAEAFLTQALTDKTQPQSLRQASYSALIKLATESAWKTTDHTSKRLVITEIVPASQAEAVGLLAGDVIVSYNRRKIATNVELREAISSVKPKAKSVVMVIERDGKRLRLKLKPGRIGIRLAEEIR